MRGAVALVENHGRGRDHGVGLAVAHDVLDEQVAARFGRGVPGLLAHERRGERERLFGVEHRRERLQLTDDRG
ncbi:MAG: hypothetical protein MUC34_14885 [Anaerolineae bacterium]|nr:hypothetical protein [Anaerolineae bacterium]